MTNAPDAVWTSSTNRQRKIYTDDGKITYDAWSTCRYTRTSKGTMVAESSLERLGSAVHLVSRKGIMAKEVRDSALLLHKQEGDKRN
jgi:hypothetical protein